MTYTASPRCIAKLTDLEGFREKPTQDGGGCWFVGYGTTCLPTDYPGGITRDQAEGRLTARLAVICAFLEQRYPGLLAHQVDALLLFAYNIGEYALINSHCWAFLKAKDWRNACCGWNMFVHDAKRVEEPGLVIRRHFETHLFVWGWS